MQKKKIQDLRLDRPDRAVERELKNVYPVERKKILLEAAAAIIGTKNVPDS